MTQRPTRYALRQMIAARYAAGLSARATVFEHLNIAGANRAALADPRTLTPSAWVWERAWTHAKQAGHILRNSDAATILP